MHAIQIEPKRPKVPRRGVGPAADRITIPPYPIPSLRRIESTACVAQEWDGVPLIPLRRMGADGIASGAWTTRDRWVPLPGTWEDPPTKPELDQFFRAEPGLGIGLKLGRRGTGEPRFVDIVVKDAKLAEPALRRMLDRRQYEEAVTWRDREGDHWLFLGDDRLEGFGPTLLGAHRGNGGNPNYPGLEIRFGSGDPATSLVILPPTPWGEGKRREPKGDPRWILSLGDRFEEDLEKFAAAGPDRLEAPGSQSIVRDGGGSRPRPKKVRKLDAQNGLRGDRAEVATTPDFSGIEAGPAAPSEDLDSLAAAIQETVRAGHLLMARGLEHFRQAGEWLEAAKIRLGHGHYEKFVLEKCGCSTETACDYRRVFRRWPEVEAMRRAKPESTPDLTLSMVVKALARPRKKSEPGKVAATRGAVAAKSGDYCGPAPDPVSPVQVVEPPGGDSMRPSPVPDPMVFGSAALGGSPGDTRPGRSELSHGNTPTQILEDRGDEDVPIPDQSIACGAIPTRSPRMEELLFVARKCPIRPQLQKTGKSRAFDADVTAWRLTRSIVGEILSRTWPTGDDEGTLVGLVLELARVRSPEEWDLCPSCDGKGVIQQGGKACQKCSGQGYRIWT